MRGFSFIAAILFAISLPLMCRADAPATEFFAVETAKLTDLAPTDATLDTLSSAQLSKISIVHG